MEHLYGNQVGIHIFIYGIQYCNINGWKKRLKKEIIKVFIYMLYKKDIDPNVHIEVFQWIIIFNDEINDYHALLICSQNIISKWGVNFVKDHPKCIVLYE
jgi:hypothetical protein